MKNSSLNHCGLWIDHTNAAEWAELLRQEVTAWLAPLAGLAPDAVEGLKIKVSPPSQEEATEAMRGNHDLRGRIVLEWNGVPVNLEIPMSYHGVFLSHRTESQHPAVSVWTGWLADVPGIRLVKSPGTAGEGKDLKWKIGLPGGKFLKGQVVKSAVNKGMARLMLSVNERMRTSTSPSQYLDSRHAFPECLSEHVAAIGVIGKADRKDLTETMWNALPEVPFADLGAATDEDDLEHRILMTFPVWLKHRVARTLLKELLRAGKAQGDLAKKVAAVLAGEAGDKDLAQEAWAYLADRQAVISRRVVVAVHHHRSTEHADLVESDQSGGFGSTHHPVQTDSCQGLASGAGVRQMSPEPPVVPRKGLPRGQPGIQSGRPHPPSGGRCHGGSEWTNPSGRPSGVTVGVRSGLDPVFRV